MYSSTKLSALILQLSVAQAHNNHNKAKLKKKLISNLFSCKQSIFTPEFCTLTKWSSLMTKRILITKNVMESW